MRIDQRALDQLREVKSHVTIPVTQKVQFWLSLVIPKCCVQQVLITQFHVFERSRARLGDC